MRQLMQNCSQKNAVKGTNFKDTHDDDDDDDDEGDSDFTDMDESWSEDSDSSNETDEAKELVQGKKYLVFESELYKLFTKCPKCYSPTIHINNHMVDSMLSISYSCLNGHSSKWNSQPLLNAMPAGNLLVSAAILFSGNTYTNINSFSNFCGLPIISETKFYDIQKQYLWPIVNNA